MTTPVHVNVPYERFLDCVHCGLCLNSCPTYVESGLEADSPRGRIHLMRAVADGKIDFEDGVKEHIDLCLGCLACETACPSGVHYREIIEAGRELSRQHSKPSGRRWMMERTLYHPDRLERMIAPLRWAGKIGLEGALRKAGSRLPAGISPLLDLLPELPPAGLRQQVPTVVPAVGEVKRKVGFITGCVMSVFFTPTNLATLHVLASNGCEIHIPPDQGCCGALAVHSGDTDGGREMARHLIDHFTSFDLDAIIINSAGCGSTLKEYAHLLAEDPAYAAPATRFAALVKDVSELLAELPIQFPDETVTGMDEETVPPLRVAYHDACHLAHGQKVRKQPRSILASMPGIEL
ncbi:MAG: heterodisulfide reductase-related iron-sulfur binding cluster, partial [Armatimonadota bacterium]|nr:heterodisulfide reductase-related iron-sulfur binding cluster [Armatimonadota bacterium]